MVSIPYRYSKNQAFGRHCYSPVHVSIPYRYSKNAASESGYKQTERGFNSL